MSVYKMNKTNFETHIDWEELSTVCSHKYSATHIGRPKLLTIDCWCTELHWIIYSHCNHFIVCLIEWMYK